MCNFIVCIITVYYVCIITVNETTGNLSAAMVVPPVAKASIRLRSRSHGMQHKVAA